MNGKLKISNYQHCKQRFDRFEGFTTKLDKFKVCDSVPFYRCGLQKAHRP